MEYTRPKRNKSIVCHACARRFNTMYANRDINDSEIILHYICCTCVAILHPRPTIHLCDKCGKQTTRFSKTGKPYYYDIDGQKWCQSCNSRYINDNIRWVQRNEDRPELLRLIRKHYLDMDYGELGKLIGYSPGFVYLAVRELGLEKLSKLVGQRHHNWTGGSPLKVQIRSCTKYRWWRGKVFGRDNRRCQVCKRRRKEINAHHVKSLQTIIDEYAIKTLQDALICEELWDINNGLTVCEPCHEEIDSCFFSSIKEEVYDDQINILDFLK